jgi:hypothetical protein
LWFWILGAICIVTLIVLETRSRRKSKEESLPDDSKL